MTLIACVPSPFFEGGVRRTLVIGRCMMYTRCMKKRTNIYLAEQDKRMIAFLREKYGLDSDASVVRFVLRKVAKEEGYVSGETGQDRQNRPAR